MKKIHLGDLFELKTPQGFAYLHFVHFDEDLGELIRVLPGLYLDRPEELKDIANKEEVFVVFFSLKASFKDGTVTRVGNYEVTEESSMPKYLRSKHFVGGQFLGWHIIETSTWQRQLVQELSDEQKKISPWGVWNVPTLSDRLTKGWNLNKWSDEQGFS